MNKLIAALLISIVALPGKADANEAFNLADHQGKIVYVDFWASWCTPCRASFPFMQDMALQYGDDLVISAINVDENRADADKFLESFTTDFNIVYDSTGDLAKEFDLQGMPTSFLYDRNGELIGRHIGFKIKDIDELKNAIAAAIGDKKQ